MMKCEECGRDLMTEGDCATCVVAYWLGTFVQGSKYQWDRFKNWCWVHGLLP